MSHISMFMAQSGPISISLVALSTQDAAVLAILPPVNINTRKTKSRVEQMLLIVYIQADPGTEVSN